MYDVCDPIFTKWDEFFAKTGFNSVENADTRHAIQGLFYAVQALNPEKDTLTLMSIKDGKLVFDPTKVGNNAESCESL